MLRRHRALIARGDVWEARIPGAGTHPVVVVTRSTAIPLLKSLPCVLVTSTFHDHVAEVALGATEGLKRDSAANCDTIFTLPTQVLMRRRGHLGPEKMAALDRALAVALGLD